MKGKPLNFLKILPYCKNEKADDPKSKTILPPLVKQTLVALGPLLLTISSGMTFGYSAILLPQLHSSENNTFQISKEEASWIASMAALPMALGAVVGGILLRKLGRKSIHAVACVPIFVGWLFIYLANDIKMILIGRFITGLFNGVLTTVTGIYIGETSEPTYRGFLLAGISFSVASGLFLSHLLGTFLSWQTTALICSLLPLLSQVIICLAPESPSWLVDIGKIEEATAAFYWCRGTSENAERELCILLERRKQQAIKETKKFNVLLVPEFLKPLGILVCYITFKQWAGINAISFYSVSIMKDTVGSGINEYAATLLIDLIRLGMSIVACFLLRRINRRPLALISGIGTTLSLLTLSLYCNLAKIYPPASTVYVPMICLIGYIIFVSIGLVPLPSSMMGELFSLKHKSVGSSISSFVAFSMFFSVVKCTPSMFQYFGSSGAFLMFGLITLIGTIFVYMFLPETKGIPLHEIEDGFKTKKKTVFQNNSISK